MAGAFRVFPVFFERVVPMRTHHHTLFRQWNIFLLKVFLFIVTGIAAVGCGPRIVRVPVSEADLIKAQKYVQEGNVAFINKDFYAALIQYLMARELNPNSEYINNYIGITYLNLKFNDKAIEAFQRAMALNSKYPSFVNNLGSAFFANHNYKKAEKYFKKAIKMKKDDASFYLNLGTLYFEMKKPDKAMKAWRQSLSLDPEILSKTDPIGVAISGEKIAWKDRYYFMARVYADAGNIPKVIESLENALLNGFSDIEQIRNNPDFDPIRNDERFVKFMEAAATWEKQYLMNQ
jgi:tetratricopeptide (TPR) repeat protein